MMKNELTKLLTNVEKVQLLNELLIPTYAGSFPIEAFLKVEKSITESLNLDGKSIKFDFFNELVINTNLDKMPTGYILCDIKEEETYNKLINNNNLKSVNNFIKEKGYSMNVLKLLVRGTKYKENEDVTYYKNNIAYKGTVVGYYFGNKEQGYPLRFKILNSISNKCTDVNEVNCKFES